MKAILFDFDDTIINYAASEKIGLAGAFRKYGIPLREEYVGIYREENRKLWRQIETGEITTSELRILRFQALLDQLGFETGVNAERLGETYLHFFAGSGELEDGAGELLQWLDRNWKGKTAILTNGFTDTQRARIEVTRIGDFFDDIFISDEMGSKKPDPLIFQKSLQKLGVEDPSEAMIVGDNLVSDIMGGKNSGLRTCWYNPGLKDAGEYRQYIDFEIVHLSEIEDLVGKPAD